MAYHLSSTKAHIANASRVLTPVKGGLEFIVGTDGLDFTDSCNRYVSLPVGHAYRITGTRDSNGYVVSFVGNDGAEETYYLKAEQGCKLC